MNIKGLFLAVGLALGLLIVPAAQPVAAGSCAPNGQPYSTPGFAARNTTSDADGQGKYFAGWQINSPGSPYGGVKADIKVMNPWVQPNGPNWPLPQFATGWVMLNSTTPNSNGGPWVQVGWKQDQNQTQSYAWFEGWSGWPAPPSDVNFGNLPFGSTPTFTVLYKYSPNSFDVFVSSNPSWTWNYASSGWTPDSAQIFSETTTVSTQMPGSIGDPETFANSQAWIGTPGTSNGAWQNFNGSGSVQGNPSYYGQWDDGSQTAYSLDWACGDTSTHSGPGTASWAVNRIDNFVRGYDSTLYHKWWDGHSWSAWDPWGAPPGLYMNSNAVAISPAYNWVHVYTTATDGQVWHKWWDGVSGHAWQSVGGSLSSAPAVSSWGPSRQDLFGINSGQLVHEWWNGSAWSGWVDSWGSPPGVTLAGDPAAISWGTNRIDVFARGTNHRMYWRYYNGAGSPWIDLSSGKGGGGIAYGAGVSSWGPNRLDLFAVFGDQKLHHIAFDGIWHTWENLGNPPGVLLNGTPAAVSWGANRIDIEVRGANSHLYHTWWNGGWGGWDDLSCCLW